MILSLPFQEIPLGDLGGLAKSGSIPQVIALVICVIISLVILGQILARHPFQILNRAQLKVLIILVSLLGLFFTFEIISTVVNNPPITLVEIARSRITSLFLFLIPIFVLASFRIWNTTLKTYYVAVLVLSISMVSTGLGLTEFEFARSQEITGFGSELFYYRNTGLLVGFGDIAILMAFVTPYVTYTLIHNRQSALVKFFALLSLILIVSAAIASQSRNVWLSVLVSVSAFWVLPLFTRVTSGKIAFYMSIPLILVIFFNPIKAYLTEMYEMATNVRSATVDSRFLMYAVGWNTYQNSPLLGVGPGGFRFLDTSMHNMYLVALLRAGIGGIPLFAFFLVVLLRLMKHIRENVTIRLSLSGYLGLLFAGFFYPGITYASPIVWVTLGVIASVAICREDLVDTEQVIRPTQANIVVNQMAGQRIKGAN